MWSSEDNLRHKKREVHENQSKAQHVREEVALECWILVFFQLACSSPQVSLERRLEMELLALEEIEEEEPCEFFLLHHALELLDPRP